MAGCLKIIYVEHINLRLFYNCQVNLVFSLRGIKSLKRNIRLALYARLFNLNGIHDRLKRDLILNVTYEYHADVQCNGLSDQV